MSRAEKASEPSMEEILASIRKIIAEDPVVPKPQVDQTLAGSAALKPLAKPDMGSSITPSAATWPDPKRAEPQRAEPSWPSGGSPQTRSLASAAPVTVKSAPPASAGMSAATSLDDVLGLADEAPPVAMPGPSLSHSPSLQASVAAAAASLLEPRRSAPSPERAPVQPFFPPQTRDALTGASQARTASAEPGMASFGAVVPNRADNRGPGAASESLKLEIPSRTPELTVGGPRLERIPSNDWASTGPQRAPLDHRPELETTLRPEVKTEAKPVDTVSPGAAMPAFRAASVATGHGGSPPVASKAQASEPASEQASATKAGSPLTAPLKADDAAADPDPVASEAVLRNTSFGIDGQKPAVAAYATPVPKLERPKIELPNIDALQAEASKTAAAMQALAGAATSVGAMNGSAKPETAVASAQAASVVTAKPMPADLTPGPTGKPGGVAEAPAAGPVTASPTATTPAAALAADEPTRTMEDTVAELLRPMLRQWLDANMPRIVEKALRVELAASVKPKPDPAKH